VKLVADVCWQLLIVQYLTICTTVLGLWLEEVWLLLTALFLTQQTLLLTGAVDGIMLRGMMLFCCHECKQKLEGRRIGGIIHARERNKND